MNSLAELLKWHEKYDLAVLAGKSPPEAVSIADGKGSKLPDNKIEEGRPICILLPKGNLTASYYTGGPPIPLEYEEVWLTPQDLRRAALLKLQGRLA